MFFKLFTYILVAFQLALGVVHADIFEGDVKAYVTRVGSLASDSYSFRTIRFRVPDSYRYLFNTSDPVLFWKGESRDHVGCKGNLLGRLESLLIIEVEKSKFCKKSNWPQIGDVFYIRNLKMQENLVYAKKMLPILDKRIYQVRTMMKNIDQKIASFANQVEKINIKYHSKVRQIELEWKKEIREMEEGKALDSAEYNRSQKKLKQLEMMHKELSKVH